MSEFISLSVKKGSTKFAPKIKPGGRARKSRPPAAPSTGAAHAAPGLAPPAAALAAETAISAVPGIAGAPVTLPPPAPGTAPAALAGDSRPPVPPTSMAAAATPIARHTTAEAAASPHTESGPASWVSAAAALALAPASIPAPATALALATSTPAASGVTVADAAPAPVPVAEPAAPASIAVSITTAALSAPARAAPLGAPTVSLAPPSQSEGPAVPAASTSVPLVDAASTAASNTHEAAALSGSGALVAAAPVAVPISTAATAPPSEAPATAHPAAVAADGAAPPQAPDLDMLAPSQLPGTSSMPNLVAALLTATESTLSAAIPATGRVSDGHSVVSDVLDGAAIAAAHLPAEPVAPANPLAVSHLSQPALAIAPLLPTSARRVTFKPSVRVHKYRGPPPLTDAEFYESLYALLHPHVKQEQRDERDRRRRERSRGSKKKVNALTKREAQLASTSASTSTTATTKPVPQGKPIVALLDRRRDDDAMSDPDASDASLEQDELDDDHDEDAATDDAAVSTTTVPAAAAPLDAETDAAPASPTRKAEALAAIDAMFGFETEGGTMPEAAQAAAAAAEPPDEGRRDRSGSDRSGSDRSGSGSEDGDDDGASGRRRQMAMPIIKPDPGAPPSASEPPIVSGRRATRAKAPRYVLPAEDDDVDAASESASHEDRSRSRGHLQKGRRRSKPAPADADAYADAGTDASQADELEDASAGPVVVRVPYMDDAMSADEIRELRAAHRELRMRRRKAQRVVARRLLKLARAKPVDLTKPQYERSARRAIDESVPIEEMVLADLIDSRFERGKLSRYEKAKQAEADRRKRIDAAARRAGSLAGLKAKARGCDKALLPAIRVKARRAVEDAARDGMDLEQLTSEAYLNQMADAAAEVDPATAAATASAAAASAAAASAAAASASSAAATAPAGTNADADPVGREETAPPPPPPPADGEDSEELGLRVRIVNGEIQLDPATLQFEQKGGDESQMQLVDEGANRYFTSASYGKPRNVARWTHEETARFYMALTFFGTDFMLIATMFPDKTRQHIKRKFAYEERLNAVRITQALKYRRAPSAQLKQEMTERHEAELMRKREEEEGIALSRKTKLERLNDIKKDMMASDPNHDPHADGADPKTDGDLGDHVKRSASQMQQQLHGRSWSTGVDGAAHANPALASAFGAPQGFDVDPDARRMRLEAAQQRMGGASAAQPSQRPSAAPSASLLDPSSLKRGAAEAAAAAAAATAASAAASAAESPAPGAKRPRIGPRIVPRRKRPTGGPVPAPAPPASTTDADAAARADTGASVPAEAEAEAEAEEAAGSPSLAPAPAPTMLPRIVVATASVPVPGSALMTPVSAQPASPAATTPVLRVLPTAAPLTAPRTPAATLTTPTPIVSAAVAVARPAVVEDAVDETSGFQIVDGDAEPMVTDGDAADDADADGLDPQHDLEADDDYEALVDVYEEDYDDDGM